MNSCFGKLVGFKRITLDGLDTKVALKNSVLVLFRHFIKLWEYWCNFQSSYERKNYMEKIMMLILEKVIMSDRHISDEQMYSFLQLFFNTEKVLN